MRRSENVATPATAFTVVVPCRTAPGAPVPGLMLAVTAFVAVTTTAADWSSSSTTGCVGNGPPATALTGWVATCAANTGHPGKRNDAIRVLQLNVPPGFRYPFGSRI